jgi:hypothetical protein
VISPCSKASFSMASESPRILFLHYWGIGATRELARGLKAALDQTQHQ